MLDEHNRPYRYREYTKEPLSQAELRDVLSKLGQGPRHILRSRDANKLGLSGDESDERLIALMAEHPGLIQRPIGVLGDKAVLGRPIEALLEL